MDCNLFQRRFFYFCLKKEEICEEYLIYAKPFPMHEKIKIEL